jgi:hypothetical protein
VGAPAPASLANPPLAAGNDGAATVLAPAPASLANPSPRAAGNDAAATDPAPAPAPVATMAVDLTELELQRPLQNGPQRQEAHAQVCFVCTWLVLHILISFTHNFDSTKEQQHDHYVPVTEENAGLLQPHALVRFEAPHGTLVYGQLKEVRGKANSKDPLNVSWYIETTGGEEKWKMAKKLFIKRGGKDHQ